MSLSRVASLKVFHQALSAAVLVVRAALSFSAHAGLTLASGRTKSGPTVQALSVSAYPSSIASHRADLVCQAPRRPSIGPMISLVIALSARFILPPTLSLHCAAAAMRRSLAVRSAYGMTLREFAF